MFSENFKSLLKKITLKSSIFENREESLVVVKQPGCMTVRMPWTLSMNQE